MIDKDNLISLLTSERVSPLMIGDQGVLKPPKDALRFTPLVFFHIFPKESSLKEIFADSRKGY